GTALRPLTRSPAAMAPCAKQTTCALFKCLGKLPRLEKSPEPFTNSEHQWRVELFLHTEPVSGLSAVSVVSAAPRFLRGGRRFQCAPQPRQQRLDVRNRDRADTEPEPAVVVAGAKGLKLDRGKAGRAEQEVANRF